ncbi:MAG: DegT/DnrJ/EryC1/StrS family aminotransferase [Planctomycetota bacterium]|nr:DegT/DnrJ/EryC1/StrS family aminotransferase [Planctomycetota bacterium]
MSDLPGLTLNAHPNAPAVLPSRSEGAVSRDRSQRQHILTVAVEDWFQVGSFGRLIEQEQWYRFETRVERNTQRTFELLDAYDTKATFFVLGWVAEQMPELVAEIASRGHEVASLGFHHRTIKGLSRDEFREDLLRAQEAIESASGQKLLGYRIADQWLGPKDLWALDVLAEEGYAYDSSVLPLLNRFSDEPYRRFVYRQSTPSGSILEVPPSSTRLMGCCLPIAGGNWFRQLPHTLLKKAVKNWDEQYADPFVMYFHIWELDPDQPRISAVDRLSRIRHYRNLDKMQWVLEDHLSKYRFGSVADRLGLDRVTSDEGRGSDDVARQTRPRALPLAPQSSRLNSQPSTLIPVSIVIPCYNEEASLPYLGRTLAKLEAELANCYTPTFILVDDRSTDRTWEIMQSVFDGQLNVRLVQHEQNSGVSAAILTGIRHADTELVCSMDCDCSYDPLEFSRMLPLMTDDVDLVTASPYHPQGRVKNVPGWRLLLSKGLSTIYRIVLPQKLHTWTSCFRVYRKSAIDKLSLHECGFLGTAELVGQLCLNGSKIVEHPATLEVRIFGESKMKTFHTIAGHLRLVQQLVKQRWGGTSNTEHSASSIKGSASDAPATRFEPLKFDSHNQFSSPNKQGTETMSDARIQLPSDQDATGRTLGAEELENVAAALRSGTLTSTKGTFVKQFEEGFASKIGSRFGHACSSGTAAIHTAIAAINPEPGDEIITTSITDMGALTPILYQGAIPVFADVDPKTYNVTAKTIEACLSDKTKAIIVTHLFGNPCDMRAIVELANAHNLPVIEDCAQSFLTSYNDAYVGTLGTIGCFSLQQGKHITTGEGGVVVTDDEQLARRMFLFINKAWGYGDANADHYFIAPNYRMSELQGAVALAQLGKLEGVVDSRVRTADALTGQLRGLPGVETPAVTDGAVHTYWKYCLRVDGSIIEGGAVGLGAKLREKGIACAPRYIQKPAFACQIFRDQVTFGESRWPFTLARPEAVDYDKALFPGTFEALRDVLVLPWNELYTQEHIDFIAEAVRASASELTKTQDSATNVAATKSSI